MSTSRTVLVAPDKFRGSLTAPQVVEAVAAGAREAGWEAVGMPLADGGEGMLEAFGGADRSSTVTGPAGTPVEAAWLLGEDGVAVIESAAASGLAVADGRERNDPMAATSRGTGELIAEAVEAGARRIIVGLGGSAMTDGGLGAVEVVLERLGGRPLDRGVELLVACDVEAVFTDAARIFGPQKGADADQVVELTTRLEQLQERYAAEYDVALADLPGAGAAGGLGGGLVVLGGQLVPGFELVAGQAGLAEALASADAVITGEGALDAESFHGKVVGGVLSAGQEHGIPVIALAGVVRDDAPADRLAELTAVSLTERFGREASWRDTAACLTKAAAQELRRLDP